MCQLKYEDVVMIKDCNIDYLVWTMLSFKQYIQQWTICLNEIRENIVITNNQGMTTNGFEHVIFKRKFINGLLDFNHVAF